MFSSTLQIQFTASFSLPKILPINVKFVLKDSIYFVVSTPTYTVGAISLNSSYASA